MTRHALAGVLALALLAAGCATDPTVSGAPPAAPAAVVKACTVPARFAGKEVTRLPVSEKLVALTFDAGANGDGVPAILSTLAGRHVKATFFLTGQFVQQYPKRSRRIAKLYLVGNHTMTHPDLTTLTDLQVTRQVRRAERVIRETTGEDPRRFFRFPFGARDARTTGLVNDLCYVPFRWTVDTLGWQGTSGGRSVDEVVQRVLDAATRGEIVLMHVGSNPDDGSTLDADALPIVIKRLRASGYSFVTLARVMNPAP